MARRTLQRPVVILLEIAALLAASAALDGSPREFSSEAQKDKTAPEAAARSDEQIRRESEELIRSIDLEILNNDKWTKVERIEKPLLFYIEPTRNNDRGTVWGWGRKGRPVAVLEFFRDTSVQTRWVFAICNTSGGKLRARRGGAPWWQENDSIAEFKDIPDAPAPAAKTPLRQRQLKLLAQKFTAHEFWNPNNSRYELRLLTHPLYTYRDEANGVLEGGLFTLAHGTNPEISLFVEARVDPKNRSKSVWQYTVGRSSHAELHLYYDGKEVYDAPRGDKVSASNQPYWSGLFNVPLDAEPKR